MNKVSKFNTLSLLSKSGEFIYILLNADDNNLRDQAEKINYQLQLEVGETDPISLEPCDKKYRPYRITKFSNKPEIIKNKENEIEFIFSYIYRNNIDYKDHFNPREHAYVSNQEWESYQCYLDFLIDNKDEIKNFLESDSEMKGNFIKEIILLAFEYSFIKTKRRINNIWNNFGINPTGAFLNYLRYNQDSVDSTNCIKYPLIFKSFLIFYFYYIAFWKRYYLTNRENPTIFKGTDYINLILSKINEQLNLEQLMYNNYIISHFPLHNKTYFDNDNNFQEGKIIK